MKRRRGAHARAGALRCAAGTLASATWTTQITGYFGDSTVAVPIVATGRSTGSAIAP
jgi:hypothetical protein